MTQKSYLWDSGGGGDASPHSESDTALMFSGLSSNNGVMPGYLNELAPSVVGASIRVATGFAVVDGHPYHNDANVDTAITTPAIGTTGHRIVLRASWGATQTVRIFDIANTDGTAAIPAATTTSGTTYDVTLCTLTITTGGVITMTDARTFLLAALNPAFNEMLQLGGGNLKRPTGLTGQGRTSTFRWDARKGASVIQDAGLGGYNAIMGEACIYSAGNFNPITSLTGGVLTLNTGADASTFGIGAIRSVSNTQSGNPAVAPDRSPWARIRVNPTAGGHANVTTWDVGWMDGSGVGATNNGAYLRRNTTGNLFFVTRQGGAETTTDMGAGTDAQRWFDIWTPDAGVTWYCYDHTTGTLATHTTNVPTAATDLNLYGFATMSAGTAGRFAISAMYACAIDE